jgi:hypothetical protein
MRLPALKRTNFELSPVLFQGNVVARDNWFGEHLYTMPLFRNPPTPSSPISNSLFIKPFESISME